MAPTDKLKAQYEFLASPTFLGIARHDLDDAPIAELLGALARRGGSYRALASAAQLVAQKGADYNNTQAGVSDRDGYFPFGRESYVHMVHVKSQRLVSLTHKSRAGGRPNFEGVMDTALDLINYASFLVEYEERESCTQTKEPK